MMQRRMLNQYLPGGLFLHGCASPTESMILKDAALRLNPAIQPIERKEKRLFDNSNPDIVKWDITNCRQLFDFLPKEIFTVNSGYIEKMSNEQGVTYVVFNTKMDINYTKKKGLYLRFFIKTRLLENPKHKPKEIVSTTSKYFTCLNDRRQKEVECENCQKIDLRKVKIISDNKEYYPRQFVHEPSKNGALLDTPPVLMDIDGVDEFSEGLETVLFFEIAPRPIRFTMVPPPLYFKGIKVPLPTCFFEPFDYMTGEWA